MRVIIKEKKWLTGTFLKSKKGKDVDSMLYNAGVKRMCCMGFFVQACGVSKHDMADNSIPSNLPVKCHTSLIDDIIELELDIAEINDSEQITNAERKAKLLPIFKKIGVDLVFRK